jgi:hypothetical protein
MTNQSRGRGQISELTHIAPIKQGFIDPPLSAARPIRYADRLRTVLEAFNAREDQGVPGVIRLFRGIHTSQWAMLDGDTRLMLNVVFDGGLHGYLRALARDVPGLLNLVWSNCEGWQDPRDDGQLLIDFIEKFQVRVNFFYAQNPELTVPDVEGLLRLRDAFDATGSVSASRSQLQAEIYRESAPLANAERLAKALRKNGDIERAQEAFWGLFEHLYTLPEIQRAHRETFGGCAPESPARPRGHERAHEVQSNVLTEYPEAHCARMLFLHFPGAEAARDWLRTLRPRVAFGPDVKSDGPYINVGFTHEGLSTLGTDPAVLSDFPPAFIQGMEARAASLGDPLPAPGVPIPRHWTVVRDGTKPVHAVVFVYVRAPEGALKTALIEAGHAAQANALEADRDARTEGDASANSQRLRDLLSAHLDAATAASTQGVMQLGHQDLHRPLVRTDEGQSDTYGVEYFGFRDGLGQPRLPGTEPTADYATTEAGWLKDRASFEPILRSDAHGLLKNATFLVARQLRQDPKLFWQSMQDQAAALDLTKQALAEQIVGRRMNGRRLDSQSRDYDPVRDRHAFDPERDAPSCPFHSHVRRSNPRVESNLARNPRLLRRSLAFLRSDDARGLMFMAFNADIETQFELIQRNWLQAGNQVGLASRDRDVLTGLQVAPKPYAASTPARFYAELPDVHGQPSPKARELRFEHAFVTLEWGIYLFFPARQALNQL